MKSKRWVACLALASLCYLPISAMATVNYTVKRGDTLWSIAAQHRVKHASVHQMIVAIQALNGPLMQNSTRINLGHSLILPSTLDEVRNALHPAANPANLASSASSASSVNTPAPAASTSTASVASVVPANVPVSAAQDAPETNPEGVAVPLSVAQTTNTATASSATGSVSANIAAMPTQSFPWGWTFLVVLLLSLAYLLWYRKLHAVIPEEIRRFAALRLGISSHRHEHIVRKYKTRHFKESTEPTVNSTVNSTSNPAEDQITHSSADAMAGAMIEMAEKNYDGAERLLQAAVTQDPENLELRLKLLELYMTTDNRSGFKKEAEQIETRVPENSPIWHQVRGMYLNQWAYEA